MSFMPNQPRRVMMTQVKLVRDVGDGTGSREETTLWLQSDGRLRRGLVLRLKGEQKWWTVDAVYGQQERQTIHDDWNVGGIVGAYQ